MGRALRGNAYFGHEPLDVAVGPSLCRWCRCRRRARSGGNGRSAWSWRWRCRALSGSVRGRRRRRRRLAGTVLALADVHNASITVWEECAAGGTVQQHDHSASWRADAPHLAQSGQGCAGIRHDRPRPRQASTAGSHRDVGAGRWHDVLVPAQMTQRGRGDQLCHRMVTVSVIQRLRPPPPSFLNPGRRADVPDPMFVDSPATVLVLVVGIVIVVVVVVVVGHSRRRWSTLAS